MNDGKLIKAARVYYGKSQQDLADDLKVDQTTISAMESGNRQSVWSGYYDKAAEILKLQEPRSDFIRAVLTSLMEKLLPGAHI